MQTISNTSTWSKLLYEFVGTAVMIYAFNCMPVLPPLFPEALTEISVRARPLAYFIMWVLAFKISGAHFNPATSLAVFITERQMKNLPGFLFTFLAQLCGAYLGIAISYLLIKDYFANYAMPPAPQHPLYEFGLDIYWGRLIL